MRLYITDKLQEDNYKNFGRHLINYGYTFESKDAEFLTLNTNPKKPKNGYDYKLNIVFEDTIIVVRAQLSGLSVGAFMMGNTQIVWDKWNYASSKSDYRNKVFMDFYPIFQKYNFPVYFTTEK